MKFLIALSITLLLLLCFWLLVNYLRFESDDAYIIYLASTQEWYRFLYVPAVYQQLSAAHLTPLTVPFYSLIQGFFPFSADAFFNTMVVLFGLWMLTCIIFLRVHFKLPDYYVVLFAVMILSVASTGTILSRFYTSHYLLGGIFGMTSLIIFSYYNQTRRFIIYLVAVMLMLMVLLSKEILIAILPISFILFLDNRPLAKKILITCILVVVAYFIYRSYMLGELIGGRAAGDGLRQGLTTILETLPSFLEWYVNGRGLLLLALTCTLFLSPQIVLIGLMFAAMLAAPALAAPHGFSHPELHADRLFIASDFALAATVTLGLARWRLLERIHGHPAASTVLGIAAIAGFIGSLYQAHIYDMHARNSLEYRITRTIQAHQPIPDAIYLPENYLLGSMIVALKKYDPRLREVTANCLEALKWEGGNNLLFDSDGQSITREELASRCSPLDSPPAIDGNAVYDQGVLRWNIVGGADCLEIGVYFPGHALYAGIRQFEERWVRPAVGEKYKLYARDGMRWWFSEEKEVIFK